MKRVIACIDASPCVHATADAAAWIAKKTGRPLILLQVLDYRPASYHLGEIGGVIGFESNAMLLKELAELDQKQQELAKKLSDDLLTQISQYLLQHHQIDAVTIQCQGDFLDQALATLNPEDIAVVGKIGDQSAEKKRAIGANVEGIIRGAKSTVLVVGETFRPPQQFIFAYEHSPICQTMLKRVGCSDLLRDLECHLIYVGEENGILDEPLQYLTYSGLKVRATYLYGKVVDQLLLYEQQYQIDFIVMGAFGHSKLHQFFLGSTTLDIFKNSDMCMLVAK